MNPEIDLQLKEYAELSKHQITLNQGMRLSLILILWIYMLKEDHALLMLFKPSFSIASS